MTELGKSEALLSGENAQLKHDLAVTENLNEKLSRDITFLSRKLKYALKIDEESKDRVATLEGDKTVLIIWMCVLALVTNAITFAVVY